MTGSGELYLSILRRIIGPTEDKALLDLCCGEMTQTRHLKFRYVLGIDVKDWPTRPKIGDFIQIDALDMKKLFPSVFDVCLCSDGIEHFTKIEGRFVIGEMEKWGKLPIIFTPLDAYKLNPDSTDPDIHKCVWKPEEFEAMGWTTEVHKDWHPELSIGAFFAWKPI